MRVYLFLFFVIFSQNLFSQSIPKLVEMADELYQTDRYLEAVEFYEKIVGFDKQNLTARFRLATCYMETLQHKKAMETFARLGEIPDHEYRAQSLYHYANLLRFDRKFNEADSIYTFLIVLPDAGPDLVELSQKQREGCLLAMRQEQVEKGFRVTPMEKLNSKFHDFGAVMNPATKTVVFATTRKMPGTQYEGSQYDGLLPDLVAFEKKNGDRWKNASSDQNFDKLNTHWAEGSGTFTANGESFYFSSCHGENNTDCIIMVSHLADGKWSEPVPLNEYINEPGSENKQPHISPAGDTLFFSSDRTGGHGGTDIWMSLKGLELESWTPAINMGGVINSAENEISPYYSIDYHCLLFASNGHIGYGGYDIYAAKGKSFFEPDIYNLGFPFNTVRDDLYFNISDSVGFLSSNRLDGKILNLYSFEVPDERLFLSLLISGESLIDTRIVSRFRNVRSLNLVTFRVEDYQGYELFEPVKKSPPKPEVLKEELTEPSEAKSRQIVYENLYFDYGLHSLRPEARTALDELVRQLSGKSYEQVSIMGYTDNIGKESYNLDLSKKRAATVKQYLAAKGIPENKLVALPGGELRPTDKLDHWFSRVLRRRVEITVHANEPVVLQSAKTYIVRQETTLEGIARLMGLDPEKLKKWNGTAKNSLITAGQTIRVYEPVRTPDLRYFIDEMNVKNIFLSKEHEGNRF